LEVNQKIFLKVLNEIGNLFSNLANVSIETLFRGKGQILQATQPPLRPDWTAASSVNGAVNTPSGKL